MYEKLHDHAIVNREFLAMRSVRKKHRNLALRFVATGRAGARTIPAA